MSKQETYNRETLRKLMLDAFNQESFSDFCFDHFPAIYKQFSAAMTFSGKVRLLLMDCFDQGEIPALLKRVQETNPRKFQQYEPRLFEAEESGVKLSQVNSGEPRSVLQLLIEGVSLADLSTEQQNGLKRVVRSTVALITGEEPNLYLGSGSIRITLILSKRAADRLLELGENFIEQEFGAKVVRKIYLRWANLSGASLFRADLSGANLSGVSLFKADLSGANLSGANLSGTSSLRSDPHREATIGAVTGVNPIIIMMRLSLLPVDLSGANLSGANLSGANLSRVVLRGADLSRANLSRANLLGADLSGADLSEAVLQDAILAEVISDEYTKWPEDYDPDL